MILPYQALPTADGHVVVATGTNKTYREFCIAIGAPGLADDPAYASNQSRVRNRAALVERLSAVFRQRTTAEWIDLLEAADVPCAPVNDLQTAFADLAAPHHARLLTHAAVVEGQRAEAHITALQRVAVLQDDIEGARHGVARAIGRCRSHDLDTVNQFGRNAVNEESRLSPVAERTRRRTGARNLFAVDLGRAAEPVSVELGKRGIACWAGDFYAVRPLTAMGVDLDKGVLRMSAVHYTGAEDVARLIAALDEVLQGAG